MCIGKMPDRLELLVWKMCLLSSNVAADVSFTVGMRMGFSHVPYATRCDASGPAWLPVARVRLPPDAKLSGHA